MHRDALATSLRRLRAERGLSLSQLARATGISSSFLSLVEQAQSDITIGRLIRLAEFYDVELADLLAGSRSSPNANVRVLRADADSMIHSDDEGVDVFDLAAGSRWTLVPMLGIYQPGGSVEVNDVNAREAMLFVLSGTFELRFVGDPPVRLRRGEGAIYRSVAPYRVANVGRAAGRILALGLHPQAP
jgi:transcriptional regulator with XRE-family HTH domain